MFALSSASALSFVAIALTLARFRADIGAWLSARWCGFCRWCATTDLDFTTMLVGKNCSGDSSAPAVLPVWVPPLVAACDRVTSFLARLASDVSGPAPACGLVPVFDPVAPAAYPVAQFAPVQDAAPPAWHTSAVTGAPSAMGGFAGYLFEPVSVAALTPSPRGAVRRHERAPIIAVLERPPAAPKDLLVLPRETARADAIAPPPKRRRRRGRARAAVAAAGPD